MSIEWTWQSAPLSVLSNNINCWNILVLPHTPLRISQQIWLVESCWVEPRFIQSKLNILFILTVWKGLVQQFDETLILQRLAPMRLDAFSEMLKMLYQSLMVKNLSLTINIKYRRMILFRKLYQFRIFEAKWSWW